MSPFLIFLRAFCFSFAAYMCLRFWTLSRLYYPITCPSDSNRCFNSYLAKTQHPPLKLSVYSSTMRSPNPNGSDLYPVWELNDFKPNESITKDVTVGIPLGMHTNGTMFVHVFIASTEGGRLEENPCEFDWAMYTTGILTTCTNHQETTLQLNSNDPVNKKERTCHWRSRITFNVMTDNITFDRNAIPDQIRKFLWYSRLCENQYLPVHLIDEMSYRAKDLLPLNSTCKEMPLTISYTPMSYGKFCLRIDMEDRINRENNENDERKDYLQKVFFTNPPNLILRSTLELFYILFALLAYERDISFWQERQTTAGLSTQTVVWRSVSIVVLFLHTMDEQKGLYTLIAVGIVSIIEIWKVLKVFQVRFCWTEWQLVFDNVDVGNKELETQAHDAQAMTYLSNVLYPSWFAVIIYTVMSNNFQKSWYSLCIQSLFNGFYSFGFLFMLPQVFINDKLKSVADLPWMVLMFRAFTSVIRDFCRFILVMPVDNVGACFLDDAIFIIYLYQRWLYWA